MIIVLGNQGAFEHCLGTEIAQHPTTSLRLVGCFLSLSCRENNVFEFVSEHHWNFPGELLSKVSGENILKDEGVVVSATRGAGGDPSLRGCGRGGM